MKTSPIKINDLFAMGLPVVPVGWRRVGSPGVPRISCCSGGADPDNLAHRVVIDVARPKPVRPSLEGPIPIRRQPNLYVNCGPRDRLDGCDYAAESREIDKGRAAIGDLRDGRRECSGRNSLRAFDLRIRQRR